MINQLYNHFLEHPFICTDTRDIKPNAIFFALKGENFNANQFAAKALEAGCSYAVIDEAEYKKDSRYLAVDDVLSTLQQLANYHRKQFDIPIIAITGSNGKTTSKELINAVLSTQYKVLATTGNLNNHIGVPLTLLNINKEHEIAIIEMGANHIGEIAMLCNIAEPSYGIITNIGKAHLEGFGGADGVIKAKNELYQYLKSKKAKVFVNTDNALLNNLSSTIDKITFGTTEDVDYKGEFVESNPFVKLKLKPKADTLSSDKSKIISTQLIGKYNFENLLAAACIGNYFKISEENIKAGLENYIPTNNRSQVIQTKNNLLLLDAYNANPSSMNAAIENFSQMQQQNKVAILGDMLELGNESEKEHNAVLDLLIEKNILNVLLVGTHFMKAAKEKKIPSFPFVEDALIYIKHHPIKKATILIKGSRGIKLEKITELL